MKLQYFSCRKNQSWWVRSQRVKILCCLRDAIRKNLRRFQERIGGGIKRVCQVAVASHSPCLVSYLILSPPLIGIHISLVCGIVPGILAEASTLVFSRPAQLGKWNMNKINNSIIEKMRFTEYLVCAQYIIKYLIWLMAAALTHTIDSPPNSDSALINKQERVDPTAQDHLAH